MLINPASRIGMGTLRPIPIKIPTSKLKGRGCGGNRKVTHKNINLMIDETKIYCTKLSKMSGNKMLVPVLKAICALKGSNRLPMRVTAKDIQHRLQEIIKSRRENKTVSIGEVRSALRLLVKNGYAKRTGNLATRIFAPEYDSTLANDDLQRQVDKIMGLCSNLHDLQHFGFLSEGARQEIGRTIDTYLDTGSPTIFTIGSDDEDAWNERMMAKSRKTRTAPSLERKAPEAPAPSKKRDFTAVLGASYTQEEAGVLETLCDSFEDRFLEPCQLNTTACKAIGSLVQRGIIESVHLQNEAEQGDILDAKNSYRLTADTVGKLYAGREDLIRYEQISYFAEVFPHDKIPVKELFYNEEDAERIEKVRKLAEPERMSKIREDLDKNGLRKSSAILLYGGPGTGKTELVKQIARETQRTLFVADPSKLTTNQYGGDEKNYRDLFAAFNYVAKLGAHQPILLFNEADGLMHKRLGSAERSNDVLHNTLQTIILQEVENLDGLFIATTNMQASLDKGFESRFVDNICVHEPNAETRFKILKSKMKDINPEWLRQIAEKYPLTGRLIDNLFINCVHIKYLSNKELDFEMLDKAAHQLCEKEVARPISKIGFKIV